ncbi:ExbD Biopolymer transport protein [Burkholderiaceae bacterium]
MAMHKSSNSDDGMMAEINITPLVDVMLVLLVIFIITAPLIVPQTMNVTLPKTEALSQQDAADPTRLLIGADGQLQLNEAVLTLPQLGETLRQRSVQPKFQLQIVADEKVPYGVVAEVMAVAQSNGATRLSFVTLPR